MNLKKYIQSAAIFWSEHLAHWHLKQLLIGFRHSSVGKESACTAGDPLFDSLVRKIPWRRDRLPTGVFLGFPGGSAGKETTCNAGDLGSIAGLGRTPGEGKGYSLQYSGLENSMDCIAHGVTKSRTRLSDSLSSPLLLPLFDLRHIISRLDNYNSHLSNRSCFPSLCYQLEWFLSIHVRSCYPFA